MTIKKELPNRGVGDDRVIYKEVINASLINDEYVDMS